MFLRLRNMPMRRAAAATLALAILANGSIALSSAKAATVSASQPTISSVVPGNRLLTVNWTAAVADRGRLAGYKVTATSPTGVVVTSCAKTGTPISALTASSGSCTFSALTNGLVYTIAVATVRGTSTSKSAVATSFPWVGATTVPAKPSIISVEGLNRSLVISWIANSNGGSPITGYVVTAQLRGKAAVACPAAAALKGSSGKCTIGGLVNGTSYTVSVAAKSLRGTSLPATQSATPVAVPLVTVPNAPVISTLSAGNASIVVTLVGPGAGAVLATGYSRVTGYRVQAVTAAGAPSGSTCQTSTVRPLAYTTTQNVACKFSGLVNGTTYRVTAQAVNARGVSASSTPKTAMPSAGPATPKIATANGWTPPGAQNQVTGSNLKHHTSYKVKLLAAARPAVAHASPRTSPCSSEVGTVTSTDSGEISDTFTVPSCTPAGDYEVAVIPTGSALPEATSILRVGFDSNAARSADRGTDGYITFSPDVIDTSESAQTVTARVRVTDDLSGVQSVSLQVYAPTTASQPNTSAQVDAQNMALIAGTRLDGIWEMTFTIPQGQGGPWVSRSLMLWDNAQNVGFSQDAYQYPATLTVSNSTTINGPSIPTAAEAGGLTISPTTFDTTASSQSITVTLTVRDSYRLQQATIALCPGGVYNAAGSVFSEGTVGQLISSTQSVTWNVTIPKGAPIGKWSLCYLALLDNSGVGTTQAWGNTPDLSVGYPDGSLDITNTAEEAQVFSAIQLVGSGQGGVVTVTCPGSANPCASSDVSPGTATVNTVTSAQSVTYTIPITVVDAGSTVQSCRVWLIFADNVESGSIGNASMESCVDNGNGTISAVMTLAANAASGTWRVIGVSISADDPVAGRIITNFWGWPNGFSGGSGSVVYDITAFNYDPLIWTVTNQTS